jgi:hypothetical protein
MTPMPIKGNGQQQPFGDFQVRRKAHQRIAGGVNGLLDGLDHAQARRGGCGGLSAL